MKMITLRKTDWECSEEILMTIYEEQGYEDREDYLRCLADDNEVDYDMVLALADMLGETEDFDGLVTSVQDAGLSM